MEVVMVSSQPYDSYNTVEQVSSYLAAALHASADWTGASAEIKAQAAVTATRVLDRQKWADAYDAQAERFAVQVIRDAHSEIALALVQDSGLQSEQTTAQQLQSVKAGPVTLSYFRGAEGRAHRFPLIVHELLRDYLAGVDLSIGMAVTGTDGTSSTEDDFGHTDGL